MRLIALLGASAGLLAACGGPSSGKVIDRTFTPAHVETYYVNQCYSYDKNGQCTVNVPTLQTDNIPDRWELRLRKCVNDGCDEGWVRVGRHAYETVEDGQWYESES